MQKLVVQNKQKLSKIEISNMNVKNIKFQIIEVGIEATSSLYL